MHALQAGRPYRGVSPADRIALRRARLVTSAVALFGTLGYPATSIKGVCMHAGLTERSFYESFGAKEDLLQTAYRHCAGRLHALITAAAEQAEPTPSARMLAALGAYFTAIREPSLARIARHAKRRSERRTACQRRPGRVGLRQAAG